MTLTLQNKQTWAQQTEATGKADPYTDKFLVRRKSHGSNALTSLLYACAKVRRAEPHKLEPHKHAVHRETNRYNMLFVDDDICLAVYLLISSATAICY
jgi:hypothetical protein